MKRSLVALTAFLSLCCACAIASNRLLKAGGNSQNRSNTAMNGKENSVLPVEKWINSFRINKVEVSGTGQITIELENSSKQPLRVWKDSNSWGAACWRLLLIRKGRLETFFQNPDRGFTKNNPSFTELAGSGHIQQKLDLNGGNWCGFGYCSSYNEHGFGGRDVSFEPGDIIVVTYDVPRTDEASKMGVWYGVIAATATVQ